jgi:hypothetical protein
MLSLSEEEQWRKKERRRGLMEVVMLFFVALFLAAIVVVCMRMDGDRTGGRLDHGAETAMAMMVEIGLSPRE